MLNDIQTVSEAINECAHFGTRFYEAWERIKKILEAVPTANNSQSVPCPRCGKFDMLDVPEQQFCNRCGIGF